MLFFTIPAGLYAVWLLIDRWKKHIRIKRRKLTLDSSKLEALESDKKIRILNFTHPLTPKNITQIESLIERSIEEIIDIQTQLDDDLSFDPQIENLIAKIGFSGDEWQNGRFIINLPGFTPAAAVLLANLHGLMGHFPTIIRLRAVEGNIPTEYELAEIINLQNIRFTSRTKR